MVAADMRRARLRIDRLAEARRRCLPPADDRALPRHHRRHPETRRGRRRVPPGGYREHGATADHPRTRAVDSAAACRRRRRSVGAAGLSRGFPRPYAARPGHHSLIRRTCVKVPALALREAVVLMYWMVTTVSMGAILVVKKAPVLVERKRLAPSGLLSSSWYWRRWIACQPTTPSGVL